MNRPQSDHAPHVSVVMAAYNGEPYIAAAIRSVLDQDFRDLELIIVDDGSTDRTAEIISSAPDSRVRYHRNERNLGQTPSLNVGLRLARGDYIARIDADDEFLPGKLSAQVRYLDAHPDVVLVGTSADCMDEHGAPNGAFSAPTSDADIRFRLVTSTPVCHVSVLMRREPVLAVGGYDESYRYAADHKLWSDLAGHGHVFRNLPETLTKYRVFSTSFGAASVLNEAGWEKARLISANAKTFLGLEVPVDDSRAIYLRSHPRWGGEQERLVSHRRLAEVARAAYRGLPFRIRVELLMALAWSVAQMPATGARGRPATFGERAALLAGRVLRHASGARLAAFKTAVTRLVRPASR